MLLAYEFKTTPLVCLCRIRRIKWANEYKVRPLDGASSLGVNAILPLVVINTSIVVGEYTLALTRLSAPAAAAAAAAVALPVVEVCVQAKLHEHVYVTLAGGHFYMPKNVIGRALNTTRKLDYYLLGIRMSPCNGRKSNRWNKVLYGGESTRCLAILKISQSAELWF
uniref:Uncharacterized protein n=1 Tax=Trichogramma kaykai TaxID=54128 RepID=A0ABD2WJH7_9HYME